MAKEIKFRIRLSVDGKEQLVTATTSSRDLQKNLDAARSSALRFRDAMLTMNQMGQAFQGLLSGLSQVNSALSSYTQAYAQQEQNEQRLATVMRERMNATAADVEQMKALASAQQQLGIVGDEVQLAGMQQLATFLKQKDTLAELVPAMNNLIAQQKGYNATASDAQSIGNLLGKAMQGQATALRRVGISFDEAQENVLKFGTESERASMLAEIITQNVGNMNAELRQTTSGQMKALSNTMGDLSEKIGGVMMPFQGIMTQVTQLGFLFLSLGQIVSTTRGVMLALGAAIKSTGIASVFFSKQAYIQTAATLMLNGASKATALSLAALKVAIRGLLIATGVGAAIAGLTYVVELLMNTSDKTSDSLDEMADSANEMNDAYKRAQSSIELNIAKLKDLIQQKEAGKNVSKQEKEMLAQLNNTYGETMGYFSNVSDWYKALTANSKAYCEQIVDEARTRELANKIAEMSAKRDQMFFTYPDPANAERAVAGMDAQIASMKKEVETIVSRMSRRVMPIMGSATPPSTTPSTPRGGRATAPNTNASDEIKYQKGSIADLNHQVDELRKKYESENLSIQEQVELLKQIKALESQISEIKEKADRFSLIPENLKGSIGAKALKIDTSTIEELDVTADSLIDKLHQFDTMSPIKIFFESNMKQVEDQTEGTRTTFKSAANALGEFGGAMSEMGKLVEDEGLQVAGIVAQAIANIALGYAQATAQAGKLGPWGWAAFAAAGLGQMIAMITQIHSATGYATGGIVGGTSYSGDKLLARLNSGEMILNKTQQNKLWRMINNGTIMGAVRPATAGIAGVAGAAGGTIRMELEGRKLVGLLSNETRISSSSGRRTNIRL